MWATILLDLGQLYLKQKQGLVKVSPEKKDNKNFVVKGFKVKTISSKGTILLNPDLRLTISPVKVIGNPDLNITRRGRPC